ncbi:cytochrome c biogenesis protein ResB [Microbacterium sp. zg.Y1090]|uniref:cytochrome c biogenesis protein ResB n=1 Tax=Microbacterium TaxID=33882 RepID=UPI00214BD961|nr:MULTISPECIES: cytochrome c biogenesis protein ResB [unclassified Microbacterium]MCR2812537.1 cytochrome c biogenesis protein ResB [Microbacterium sp. zg.Y1084]MCR2817662.1 cytochrome c biogenesis protein ResB [Microbacterium sp. zg.Y1090]MDL5485695.1 cytochrome c biogenesis protein ResB [Microbacterium sp. zg-Y1211]WIM28864.1 cytochrome c biogenesis protein ResB [Microbacterium sp. zg-Y1090]
MSSSRSDDGTLTEQPIDGPLRPSDHADGAGDGIRGPALGGTGWLRWGWRQLTSMRTAIVLLLLLAIAAVPGSIVPQRSADPNGVTQFRSDNPDLYPVLDAMSMFDVYTSPWFSAIYLLLFISLIGCVIPRTKHHWKALRSRPPRTPARLTRLDDHTDAVVTVPEGRDADAVAAEAIALADEQLRKAGYRVERYDDRGTMSVSAERGYLRETGNLVFHASLVGVLIAVGVGGGYTYTGQDVLVEGQSFVNTLADYSSFNPGRFVDTETLPPYSMTLEEFQVSYVPVGEQGAGQAGDFAAVLTTRVPGGDEQPAEVRVNHPVDIEGDRIYLMGNGYAPTLTIRDADGDVVYSESVPFLPQDAAMTSLGVVKVPDGMPEQLGMVGFFYPTAAALGTGALTSVYPDLVNPVLTLDVYAGDLGIDDGTPRSVYTLDPEGMEQLTGRAIGVDSIELAPGETADLPNGWGTITFENTSPAGVAGYAESVPRFASLSIHRDVGAPWVLLFAVLATTGLMVALFVPRRRMWVKATVDGDAVRLEYAGLARGEDPTLRAAVDDVARRHGDALESRLRTRE